MVSKAKQLRELLPRAAMKSKKSVSRVESETANCVLFRLDEWEEIKSLMAAADTKSAVYSVGFIHMPEGTQR